MKKLSIVISCLILSIFATCTFAEMRIEGFGGNVISDPHSPFEGKIGYVSYGRFNGTEQKVWADVSNNENQMLQITFTGPDLPVGIALLNAIGKTLVIGFSDTKFTVEDVFTYNDDPSKAASVLQQHNLLKQSK